MKRIVHVSQTKIRHNSQQGDNQPCVIVVKDEELDFAHELVIYGQDGKEAARVVYRPYDPLPSEAVVWVETDNDVKMIVHESN
jgi:hypothetical protein